MNRDPRPLSVAMLSAIAALTLTACLTPVDHAPTEVLDEHTGDTYTTVAQPLVFARRRIELTAEAREFVSVIAARINHAGQLDTYLVAYRWATFELTVSEPRQPAQGTLRFIADGRDVVLRPLDAAQAREALRPELAPPRTPLKLAWAYAANADTLRQLAQARQLSLQFPDDKLTESFELFSDGRTALQAFSEQVGN